MTQRSTQSRADSRCASLRLCFVAVCVSTAILGGCAAAQKPRAKTFPWAATKSVRPLPLTPVGTASPDGTTDESAMEVAVDVPPPPSPLTTVQTMPQRPRIPAAPAAQTVASRPEPPQIAPQLTAAETAAAQQQTSSGLEIAERNIAAARGRVLNATQSDLASKVRSFVSEAREAAHVGDWTRASNAAKKAQVLSEELAGSF
jgi:hypothetical protein